MTREIKRKIWFIRHILFGKFQWTLMEVHEGIFYKDGVKVKNYRKWVLEQQS